MATQYYTATSLDGFIATEDHSLDWLFPLGDLAGQFHDAGLLDELIVQVGSVTLGSGRPLLPRRIAFPPLRLTSVKACGPGFAELRYAVPRPAGAAAP